jgi:hypothetical protein
MSRFLVKACVTLLIVAGLTSLTRAQDNDNVIRPNTKAGSAAWMFTIGGLGTFGIGQMQIGDAVNLPSGSGVAAGAVLGAGYKYYLSDDLALRALLGFNTSSSGDEAKAPGKYSTLAWGIAAGIEMHTHAVYSTSPYFGAQLSFAGANNDLKNTPSGGQTSETKNSGSTFGIEVLAGFDWYFTRGIAVGAEYTLGFSSMSSSLTSTSGGTSTTTDAPSSTSIGISSGNVHLIVHF